MIMDESTRIAFDKAVQRIRAKKKKYFLECYFACNLNITKAALTAGNSRRVVYDWRKQDKVFAEAFEAIEELWRAGLENYAVDLAEGGSERLISQLLKAKLPNEYADPTPQVNVHNSTAIVNPDRSQEERMKRTREVMEAIRIATDGIADEERHARDRLEKDHVAYSRD